MTNRSIQQSIIENHALEKGPSHPKRLKSISKKAVKRHSNGQCPCRISEITASKAPSYSACCQPYHEGESVPTAEALMRSRFSAFALNLSDYLLTSWHSKTRPDSIEDQTDVQWFYLKIVTTDFELDPTTAQRTDYVTFEARYRFAGKVGKLREKSRFVREEGALRYLDGIFLDE